MWILQDVRVPLGPGDRDGYRRVSELALDLRHALSLADSEVVRGQLAGLIGDGDAAPFRRDVEMSDVFRGGMLAGRLYRRLLEKRHRLDWETMRAAAVYGASVAQAAIAGEFDLPEMDLLLKEHTVACIRASRQGHGLDEASERVALLWLADELRLPVSAAFLVRWRELRERRIARIAEE